MKRTYNYIPLRSIFHLLPWSTKIRIVDISTLRWSEYADKVITFEGTLEKFEMTPKYYDTFRDGGVSQAQIEYATLHGMRADEDTLEFTVCLKYEEY